MGAPVNYSHLTPDNIRAGRKYHVTLDELSTLSGEVASNLSALSGLTGNWESTYNTVLANSAEWSLSGSGSTFNATYMSGVIDNIYSTVNANSAEWALSGGGSTDFSSLTGLTGNWQNTYTSVYPNSGNWQTVSGKLDTVIYQVASGKWQNTYSTVAANSAEWSISGTTAVVSGSWQAADNAEVDFVPTAYAVSAQMLYLHLKGIDAALTTINNWILLH